MSAIANQTASTRSREAGQVRDRRPYYAVAATLAVIAVGALWLTGSGSGTHGIPSAIVQRGDVRITVTESGELRAENQATINATNDKQIVWLAPEGTWVEKGDPLVRFEAEKYEIAKGAAQSALQVARANVVRAQSDLAAQRANEQKARIDYEALPELAEKGFINAGELERARLRYVEVSANTRAFEAAVTAARAEVERAQQEVEQQERKLREGLIAAPRDGLVVYASVGNPGEGRKVEVGMTPFEGMSLMYLPDTSTMRVDTEISEFDLAKVAIGGSAELRLEAYPDAVFEGEVTSIASLARRKISRVTGKPTGVKVFDVSIKVLSQDEQLRPGLTTTVDIVVSENPNVLYVPIAAIFLDELDRTIVYRADTGTAHQVDIAGTTARVAIVKAGLSGGDEILLSPPRY